MIVALIDNGSLEPAAHRNLRAVAAALSHRAGVTVHAVSWKHSDRLRRAVHDHEPAATLAPWVRRHFAAGEREFVFIPFFISAQGAIGSALRADLEMIRAELSPLTYTFTRGVAAPGAVDALAGIVADRIRATIAACALHRPNVIVVDHGGPSPESAAIRDEVAAAVRARLDPEIGILAAASMEGADYAHNRPLLADQISSPGFDRDDLVIAPLFLSPGRHAGLRGDLARIAGHVSGGETPRVRHHFTELAGTHPRIAELLAASLRDTLVAYGAENESRALRATTLPLPFEPGTNFQPLPNFA